MPGRGHLGRDPPAPTRWRQPPRADGGTWALPGCRIRPKSRRRPCPRLSPASTRRPRPPSPPRPPRGRSRAGLAGCVERHAASRLAVAGHHADDLVLHHRVGRRRAAGAPVMMRTHWPVARWGLRRFRPRPLSAITSSSTASLGRRACQLGRTHARSRPSPNARTATRRCRFSGPSAATRPTASSSRHRLDGQAARTCDSTKLARFFERDHLRHEQPLSSLRRRRVPCASAAFVSCPSIIAFLELFACKRNRADRSQRSIPSALQTHITSTVQPRPKQNGPAPEDAGPHAVQTVVRRYLML